MLFYCMDPRFYQKILQNYIFFRKKLRYLKSKISTKFKRLLFLFYFFRIFDILFSISPIQTCPKIMEFFEVFYWKGQSFTNNFWKILKVLLKKIQICELLFFCKILGLLFVFLIFFIIFDILFSISSICTCQKIIEIFILFYFMDQRFYQRILENHGLFF